MVLIMDNDSIRFFLVLFKTSYLKPEYKFVQTKIQYPWWHIQLQLGVGWNSAIDLKNCQFFFHANLTFQIPFSFQFIYIPSHPIWTGKYEM